MKSIFLLFFICFLIACKSGTDAGKTETTAIDAVSEIVENQSGMDSNINVVMAGYLSLRDGFVEADTTAINTAATRLVVSIDSIFPDHDEDTAQITPVRTLFGNIAAESKGLIGESDLTEKRREFSMLSDNLMELLKTTQYRGPVVYRQTCPMAFNDTEAANWLSNSSEVINPYLGKKHPKYSAGMLHCGEVTDSIRIR